MTSLNATESPRDIEPAMAGGLPQSTALLALLAIEIVVFSVMGTNFLSLTNFFEIVRHSVELGVLALALTAVIVTGGIDLSVGALLGLCAVLLGKLWRDAGMPIPLAIGCTLVAGLVAGRFNALLVSRLRIPPLIVTLGSMSLFRGLAEGITGGSDNFTGFPASFIALGQGYFGSMPFQLPVLVIAAGVFYVLLHRSIVGRAWTAIGFSREGAHFAALPVRERLNLSYSLSGLSAAVAAVVYVARAGQAKADAGTGYELAAITAVVLGGTSIFGGRGSIIGTLIGLFAIAVLQNGLRLSDGPPDLAGVLTGLLLLVGIGLDVRRGKTVHHATIRLLPSDSSESLDMRNSQLTALCVVILVAALIVVAGNWMVLKTVAARDQSRPMLPFAMTQPTAAPRGGTLPAKQLTIGMMPKSIGNAYFVACREGAEKAAQELNVKLLWDGPTDPDPAKQNEIVETWITRGVDVIAISVENRDGLSTALRRAREKGIKVVTWDADAAPDARDFFVNQATPEGIGSVLMDDAAKAASSQGQFAIITSSLTAANQNEWIKFIKARQAAKYPNMELLTVRPCDDLQNKAFEEATTLLAANPKLKVLLAVCVPGVPGSAEAVKQSGRPDVKVVGLGLPNENKKYVKDGVTAGVVLWNTHDLGYLAVYAANAIGTGELKSGATKVSAGSLGDVEVKGDNVMLGTPFTFDRSNIDRFNF